jgi:hypothetical protein
MPQTLLWNATLIDGTGRDPQPAMAVVVEDERSARVAPTDALTPPRGASATTGLADDEGTLTDEYELVHAAAGVGPLGAEDVELYDPAIGRFLGRDPVPGVR